MQTKFTIPGEPKGKGRPRFSMKTGFPKAHTPETTASYENLVKVMYLNAGGQKHDGAIQIEAQFFFPIPQSKSKKAKQAMKSGLIRPTVKPDTDNLLKAVLDGLGGVAFDDDKQVVSIITEKWYSEDPRAEVSLREIG